jgi:hypothetical protein
MDWDGEDECALNACGLISDRQRAGISSVVHEARYGGRECLKARGGRGRRCDGAGWDEEGDADGDADATDGLCGSRRDRGGIDDAESGGWMSSSSDDEDAFWDIKYRLRSHWRYCSQEASDSDGEGWSAGLKAAGLKAAGGPCVGSAADAVSDTVAPVDAAGDTVVGVAVDATVVTAVATETTAPTAPDAAAAVVYARVTRSAVTPADEGRAVRGDGGSIRTDAADASESAHRPAGTR